MKYGKGFAPLAILVVILAIGAVGGVAYYAGKNSNTTENMMVSDTFQDTNETIVNNQENTIQANNTTTQSNPAAQQGSMSSCLVFTAPVAGALVSFPANLVGYIDVAGAAAGTCTRWTAFEGTAGNVVVKDSNGNTKSASVKLRTVGTYSIGMQQWPVTATIQNLIGTPYSNQIRFHVTGDAYADGEVAGSQVLGPFTFVP